MVFLLAEQRLTLQQIVHKAVGQRSVNPHCNQTSNRLANVVIIGAVLKMTSGLELFRKPSRSDLRDFCPVS